jgi:hypothetical protein
MHNLPNATNTQGIRVLAHLKTTIRRHANATMDAEEAAGHLDKIGLVIFWLSMYFERGTKRLPVEWIFRITATQILRHFEFPDSIPLASDLPSALRLLQEDAILLGCCDRPDRLARPLPCSDEIPEENWANWAPAYLSDTDDRGADHPCR